MKKAIEFLRSKGVVVSDDGIILDRMPDGLVGITLMDELEDFTVEEDFCYTVVEDKVVKIDI